METGKILQFSINTGETMLKNGGETYRVEDTMLRILKKYNFQEIDVFVTTTGIFASVVDENGVSTALVKRIIKRTTNLEKIALLNSLSRQFVESKITIDEAQKQLGEIKAKPPYPHIYKCIAASISCASFALLFGGSFKDALAALICGFLLHNLSAKLSSSGRLSSSIVTVINGAFVAVFILLLYELGIGENTDKGIIGTLMLLVPGVGLTNAVRDIMDGDYISGTSRIVDALIIAICIATGVGAGLTLCSAIKGGF
ncbi:threonine/serine exporter family protein [Tyzzerella sp. OttesenSCG-928-J15]|nr:threonine/serine exporter family protein [Tyzzerella sp. OttesenSCG-928-J15]